MCTLVCMDICVTKRNWGLFRQNHSWNSHIWINKYDPFLQTSSFNHIAVKCSQHTTSKKKIDVEKDFTSWVVLCLCIVLCFWYVYVCKYIHIKIHICLYKHICRHIHICTLGCSNRYKHMYWCIMKYNIFQIEFWIQFVCSVWLSVFPWESV